MLTQFLYAFKGTNNISSQCNVRVFSDDGETFILFENMDIGQSVTNASELLATQITKKLGLNPNDCRFFETYSEYDYETIDEILYTWENGIATNAFWKPAEEFRQYFLE
jgi:hypothetical protein